MRGEEREVGVSFNCSDSSVNLNEWDGLERRRRFAGSSPSSWGGLVDVRGDICERFKKRLGSFGGDVLGDATMRGD